VALALLAGIVACDGVYLEPDFVLGTIQGTVTVAGVPRAGVAIMASRPGDTEERGGFSDASGHYSFMLASDSWTVTIAPIAGAECPVASHVSIISDQTVTKDFECTPLPGTLMGVVALDDVPVPGVTVLITDQQSGDVTSAVTDGEGAYTMSLGPGRYAASAAIINATCDASPQTVEVVASGTVVTNVVCRSILGTVLGNVTLNGAPAAGVTVEIVGEDASGQPVVLASVLTDDKGAYLSLATPGVRSVQARIDGARCSGPTQVTVVAGQDAVADFACVSIAGPYSATLTETANTCGTPLQPAFMTPLAVGYRTTAAGPFIDLLPGDRPEETTATGPYDPAMGAVSAVSPPFDDSGITFQEFWAFVIGLSGVGVTFDGTVDVTLSVGSAGCVRTFGLAAIRTGA
jgi:hypothetical protein